MGSSGLGPEIEHQSSFDLALFYLGDGLVDLFQLAGLAHDGGAAVGVELEGFRQACNSEPGWLPGSVEPFWARRGAASLPGWGAGPSSPTAGRYPSGGEAGVRPAFIPDRCIFWYTLS